MVNNDNPEGFNRKRILFYVLPAVAYAALIFALSSFSVDVEELRPIFRFDKLLHLVEYYILGYLLMRAFTTSDVPRLAASPVAVAILVGCAYGLSDEIHQAFVPNRSCDLRDWIADTAGAAIGAGIAAFLQVRRSRASIGR